MTPDRLAAVYRNVSAVTATAILLERMPLEQFIECVLDVGCKIHLTRGEIESVMRMTSEQLAVRTEDRNV